MVMKTILLKSASLIFVLLMSQISLFAQGNVTAVTPSVGNLQTTVVLQISGGNTVFTQATSVLKHATDNLILTAATVAIVNDSTISAEYVIPNDPYLVGLWDVYADDANPLQDGFLIEPTGVVLKGSIYRDNDANCIYDPTEWKYYWSNFVITVQPGNITVPVTWDGRYAVNLPLGTYNATLDINFPNWPNYTNGMFCDTFYTVPINAPTPQVINGPNFGVSFNHIKGVVYVDSNNDCIPDSNELRINYGYIRCPNPFSRYATIQSDGTFDLTLPAAPITSHLERVTNYYYYYQWDNVTCPVNNVLPFSITNYNSTILDNQNFGVEILDTCVKLISSIYTQRARPCFNNSVSVRVLNISPYTAYNVETTIDLDPRMNIINISSFNSTPTVNGNQITFNYDSIAPFEDIYISIYDSILCSANLGDTLYSKVNTTYSPIGCMDSIFNFDESRRILTLSWDPNNKETTSHLGENIAANEDLEYVINFQNTGTDTAFTVTLLDTLPPQLIPSSLMPIMSSHNYTYHLVAPNVIKFLFHNIQLPDSNVNEPGSNGFIKFSIKQTPNNPLGTVIKNKAAIYFDFNEPVITNYTHNVIPLITANQEANVEGNVKVMPNPFSDATRFVFTNKSKNTTATLQLFDVTGKLVDEITNIASNSYEYKNMKLVDQMYFYKVFDQEQQLGVGKLMIKK